jgi:hypothetical protein
MEEPSSIVVVRPLDRWIDGGWRGLFRSATNNRAVLRRPHPPTSINSINPRCCRRAVFSLDDQSTLVFVKGLCKLFYCSNSDSNTAVYSGSKLQQTSNDVNGSIDYGFISHIPFSLQSRDDVQMTLYQTNNDTTAMNTIKFSSLLGEWRWKRTYKRVY